MRGGKPRCGTGGEGGTRRRARGGGWRRRAGRVARGGGCEQGCEGRQRIRQGRCGLRWAGLAFLVSGLCRAFFNKKDSLAKASDLIVGKDPFAFAYLVYQK